MKHRILLPVLMILLPMMASAQIVVVDGITYNLITKGKIAEVMESRDSTTTTFEIWDEKGDSIKLDSMIVRKQYSGDVVIPEKVTYNEVEYNVTTIREKAFANCSLNSIEIPSSITKVCSEAFSKGSASTVKIKDLAAWCKISFESYFQTNPLYKASHFLLNDKEIHDMVIPDGVTTIGNWQFYQFSGLTSVKIPRSVTSIGRECFALCSNLKAVEIGDNTSQEAATVLGQRAFYHCDNVESVFLGNNIVEIGKESFGYIKGLRNIVIPNSVKTMNTHVFAGCEGLESVQLSENINSIEWACFAGCTNLKEIVIPDGVEFLGESAFAGCTNLASAKLPSNLKKIDWSVFQYCTSLTSIEIPDLTHTIYICAFDGCTNLKTVTLGNSVQNIQNGAFANCPSLEDVYCKAKTPPTCYSAWNNLYAKTMDSFYDSYLEYITLHVPEESVDTYKATEPWKNFKEIVAIDYPVSETPKCEKPTISYVNGQLKLTCATDGVEYVTDITDTDIKKHYDATISLTTTYNISVYATKVGYEKSDVANVTLCWIDATPQTKGDIDGISQVAARAVLMKSNNGFLTVEGLDDQTQVTVYTIDGKQAGSATSHTGVANVATDLKPGSIAIVKVGEKSVKVVVR